MRFFKQRQQKGFTLVEMLVVAPIVILAIGGFLTVIISMTGEVLASRASNNLSYNVQDALNHIDQDVKLSSSFMANDYIPNSLLGTAQGYNDDNTHFTNVGGTSGTSLILNMVATDSNPISTNSSYIFLKNQPNACATPQSQTFGNKQFTYVIVYFVKNNNLYRRVMMPTNYNDTANTVCAIPWQQPSCSPTYMNTLPSSPFCKTKDIELVDGVAPGSFAVQYYSGQSATTVNATASNTSASDANRNVALQSATTVGVSIDATQNAAGHTVERSAILRTSRLDGNASGIATVTTDGAPSAPVVAASIAEPTSAVFKWARVPLATGYTIQYQINGGSWQTGFTNQNLLTYTVTSSNPKDVVNAQVVAINGNVTPNLTSSTGTATVTAPLWASPALQNGWINYSPPYTLAGYTKTTGGLIILKGLVKNGTVGNAIFTLPAGYRPAASLMFQTSSNSAGVRLDIRADGSVIPATGSNAWFSLDGIAFVPASNTFTAATLLNGWHNYSVTDPQWQNAGYTTDSAGRVETTGLIAGGTTTSGTQLFTMPAADAPSEYMHILNDDANAPTHFSIDSGGNVLEKGYGNSYYSLQEIFFPASRAVGTTCTTQWCSLTLNSPYSYYGAPYSSPLYTKSSDGVVMLKGLIKSSGAVTAAIATLPIGYCPGEGDVLMATASNGVWSRMDVIRNADGSCYIIPAAGASASWIVLDDLRWLAEP